MIWHRAIDPRPVVALVQRELRAQLRSAPMFVGVGVFAAMLVMLCCFNYPYAGGATTQLAVRYAQSMLGMQLFFLWLAAVGALPMLSVFSVHRDHQSGTHEHLACTSLTPRSLYLGKACALVAVFLVGACSVLPISGIAFFLAGAEVRPYLIQLATLSTCCVCITLIALRIGTRITSTPRALITATTFALMIAGGATILNKTLGAAAGPAGTLVLILLALGERATLSRRRNPKRAANPPREPRTQAGRAMLDISDGANPVAAKDKHLFTFARHPKRMRIVLFLVGFLGSTIFGVGLSQYSMFLPVSIPSLLYTIPRHFLHAITAMIAIAILLPDSSASTLEALRCSRLDAGDYLRGKTRAIWGIAWPFLAGSLTPTLLLCTVGLLATIMKPDLGSVTLVQFLLGPIYAAQLVARFQLTLLFAIAGMTIGRSVITSVAGALGVIAAGHLVLTLGSGLIGRLFFVSGGLSSQNIIRTLTLHGLAQTAMLGVFLLATTWFARWHIARVWRGAGT